MAEGSARDRILGRVYRAVGSAAKDPERRKAVAQRLASHPENLIPKRAFGDKAHRLGLFWKMVEEVKATTERVNSAEDVPEAVAGYLRQHNLPQRLRHGEDALLKELPWAEKAPALEISYGPAVASDDVSVSHAFAGIAETGTLVLTSGADNPTTLNFLPENHVVVLKASDIDGTYEEAWQRLREVYGEGEMPRTVNMVTGPSRTGDIEQRIELGAHGPRRLHIIIVKD